MNLEPARHPGAIDPVVLRTARLVLDRPTLDDVDRIAAYCAAPEFERFMSTPWPYHREHAVGFVTEYVPSGWARGRETTWAIRDAGSRLLLGAIGLRLDGGRDLGFWLGGPHRGRGYVVEAGAAVLEWAFGGGVPGFTTARWFAVPGNLASAGTARALGFRFDAGREHPLPMRDGSTAPGWLAERGPVVDPADRASWDGILS